MKMPSYTLCVILAVGTGSAGLAAADRIPQEIAAMLGPKFTLDAAATAEASAAMRVARTALLSGIPDLEYEDWVFRYDGSLDKAFRDLKIDEDADVDPPTEQHAGTYLGLMTGLFAEPLGRELGGDWLKQAKAQAQAWAQVRIRKFTVSPQGRLEYILENPPAGETVEFIQMEGMSPAIDFDRLKFREGTYLLISRLRFRIPEGMAGEEEDDDMGWGPDETGSVLDGSGLTNHPAARLVDPGELADEPPVGGDALFLVEAPARDVIDFFVSQTGRHCRVSDEYSQAWGEREVAVTQIDCLTHDGEMKEGDDVIAVMVCPAPRSVVADVVGRPRGTWSLVAIARWVEGQ